MALLRTEALGVEAKAIDLALAEMGTLDKLLGGAEAVLNQATDEVKPLMRGMLQQNFAASGIQSRTGKLAAAVNGAVITRVSSGLKATLANSGSYEDGAHQTSVYRVAGSLNYGAVHQPRPFRRIKQSVKGSTIPDRFGHKGILGDKGKRTIKKIALGQAVSQRALSSAQHGFKGSHISRKGVGTEVKNDTAKSVAVGNMVVLKPRPFFFFSQSQREELARAFRSAVQKRVNQVMGSR